MAKQKLFEVPALYQNIESEKVAILRYKPEVLDIPAYIRDNLKYEFFDWQREAFENLLAYQEEQRNSPTHLMFNMATGTGKTLLMAATILYYYKQGYRHFLFFVNQKNIVDKTENNFLYNSHTKYLYKDKIVIDNKTVSIKKVDTFSDTPQGIEIKFTTIQKLYNDIHIERENQTSLSDLQKKNIIMLADEAHHLNADTRNKDIQGHIDVAEITGKTSKEEIERRGWEHTVIELILKKNGQIKDNKNVLLEFTATIPENENIKQKYADKIIYKIDLKQFLQTGYTKEINLISSSLIKKERILQALIFHWYRHKIALKNNIANFKPVILFRSKTIEESKADYEEFLSDISRLEIKDFDFLSELSKKFNISQSSIHEMGKSRTEQVLRFIATENIHYTEIVDFIKNNFTDKNTTITNSKSNTKKTEETSEEQEKLLNSLEDKNNHIRAIFTVQRLTEGWDVLNLFDIVRLYEGRDEGKEQTGKRKTGSSTTAEKQLIGRGIRYFPFQYNDKIKNKRKFDGDLFHELRVLEELFFYSTNDHRYIDELKRALKKDGYIKDNRVFRTFDIKEEFKTSEFYKHTKIWYNEQKDNPNRRKKTLEDIAKRIPSPYALPLFNYTERDLNLLGKKDGGIHIEFADKKTRKITKRIGDIERHIFRKAISIKAKQENSLLQFSQVTQNLEINSIEELQTKIFKDFSVDIQVSLDGYQENTTKRDLYKDIPNKYKLDIALFCLDYILEEWEKHIHPQIGTEFKYCSFEKKFGEPKTKSIKERSNLAELDKEMKGSDWYVLDSFCGTDEEEMLIKFMKGVIVELEEKYEEVYLLRNEEVYKIYDFEEGRGFQPDFLLFLKDSNLSYQIFIEPKGTDHLKHDSWKEKFLLEITHRYGNGDVLEAENENYSLIGLPFFNNTHNDSFKNEFEKFEKKDHYD